MSHQGENFEELSDTGSDGSGRFYEYLVDSLVTQENASFSSEGDLDWVDRIKAEREAFYARKAQEAAATHTAVVEQEVPASETPVVEEQASVSTTPTPTHVLIDAPTSAKDSDESVQAPERSQLQVEEIVDKLFDRFQGLWDIPSQQKMIEDKQSSEPTFVAESEATASEPTPPPVTPVAHAAPISAPPASPAPTPVTSLTETQNSSYYLREAKYELNEALRTELPRAMRNELIAKLHSEIIPAVKQEVAKAVSEELGSTLKMLRKLGERLGNIETRIGAMEGTIEGALDREIKINFPKGAINVPVTVPEREVKIATPINVEQPAVHIDKGAIQVEFVKSSSKKQVKFERDPHNDAVKSAEIVDA